MWKEKGNKDRREKGGHGRVEDVNDRSKWMVRTRVVDPE